MPFYAMDFWQLDRIRVKSETIAPFSTMPNVVLLRIRPAYGVTVHGRYAAVARLPCVFYIVSQIRDFVKNFFRLPRKWSFSSPVFKGFTGHSSPRYVAVAVPPLLDCTWIISQVPGFVKKNFRFFRILDFMHGARVCFAVPSSSLLALQFLHPSARLPLLLSLSAVMA